MPVSIKDIAKKLDVSPSTVSRALHNHPRISRAMCDRVQAAAREMDYVPSAAARDLVAQRSAMIGVALADFMDPYYARQILGMEEAATAHGYQIVFSCFYRQAERERAIVRSFQERRMEGIIITGSEQADAYGRDNGYSFGPTVLINSPTHPHSVSIDGVAGAKAIVTHLIELGHRRIAYVAWQANHQNGRNRLNGYRAALAERAIPLDEALIVSGDGGTAGGVEAVARLLALPQPPTAIFCFNDRTAIGVLHGLRQQGYDVPRDFAVAGYDDLEMALYYHPPLTTVRQPSAEIGRRAVSMLLRLLAGAERVEPEIVAPRLVVRRSTVRLADVGY